MPLVACAECGQQISVKAHFCPNCGAPQVGVSETPPPLPETPGPFNPYKNLPTYYDPQKPSGRNQEHGAAMKISVPVVIVVLIFGAWAYFGFPSPDTLANWPDAKQSCVEFAEKHKADLFFGGDKKIRAVDSWLKNGRVVVEIGAFNEGSESYTPRLCVIGGGSIQIVSILEMGAWR
jgi:zinc-ribbon domain